MSKSIFEPAPDFDQPIAVLKHCHDKIRKQLLTMQKLQDHLTKFGADLDAQQGATAILRYFGEAAPKHHADEEEDLLPMLQSCAVDQDKIELDGLLPDILREHQEMETIWNRLAAQLQQIASGITVVLSVIDAERFVALYTAHMVKEEAHIAPMAKRLFTSAQMAQLGHAMRQRRNIAM